MFKGLHNKEKVYLFQLVAGEDGRENYLKLHSSPGYIRLLCFTVFTLVRDPHMRNTFSNFLWEEEEKIHNNQSDVFICLRTKLGSDALFRFISDNLSEPGCFKKVVNGVTNKGISCMNKLSPVVLKSFLSIFRIILFNLDSIKDIVLWVFLYSRIDIMLETSLIDGPFVVILIWFNLATILFAQSMMGAILIKRANRIITVPKTVPARVILFFTLIITIPFLPCLLLLQVSSIATQEAKLILGWQKVSNSPSSVARALLASKKERQFFTETYAQLRLLEGVCESLPQIILLIGYFIVSLVDPDSLSISDGVYSNIGIDYKGVTFFALSILYSMLTLLFSLVNVVNTSKGDQLSISQKACLGLVYLFQLVARLTPVCFVIFFTIVKMIPMTTGLLLLIVPLIFHMFSQYLVTYFTAPTFRQLDTFQQVIHILANTMLVFPLRTKKTGKQEHRNKEICWSLALVTVELVAIFVGTVVGHLVTDVDWREIKISFHPITVLLVFLPLSLIMPLLCATYLSQCLYYRCCHTWSLINKPHYSCCYPMCGSKTSIFEEEEQEQDLVELDKTEEKDGQATLPTRCWQTCKMRLYCSCGSCKDSVGQEIAMDYFQKGSSNSLPCMGVATNKTYQARFTATL